VQVCKAFFRFVINPAIHQQGIALSGNIQVIKAESCHCHDDAVFILIQFLNIIRWVAIKPFLGPLESGIRTSR
jgi:hypothetical protein